MDPRYLALAPSLAVATAASGAPHAHEEAARHGGRVADAGPYHVELAARGAGLDLFVTDAGGQAVPADGFSGTAVLVVGGKPVRVPLVPAGGNRLSGTASTIIEGRLRGAVRVVAPDGRTASARFD